MAKLRVRPATDPDLPLVLALDHGYSTDHVWQMSAHEAGGETTITFRTVRLPRSVRAPFPRDTGRLKEAWERRVCFLVAEEDNLLKGYLNLTLSTLSETAWVADFAVERRFRRAGVGSVLLASAIQWAQANHLGRLILEVQSKNYPAICFAQKHGFSFCGYNDRYYPNQDVALFFGIMLK